MSQRNLASSDVWRQSLVRSRARRAAAVRAARRRLRTRGGAFSIAAVLAITGAGGALAGAHSDGAQLLKRGGRGDAVATVQRALGVPADGVYGPVTERAVRKYQQRKQLTVDGVVGPQTIAALDIGQARIANASYNPGGSGGSNGGSGKGSGSAGVPAVLDRIAQCESGGNPHAIGGGGLYRGKYQFTRSTWASVGGNGDPAKASEAEQDKRAVMLYHREGTSPWGCA